jgi:SAM-dependent methyltransferase
MNIKHLISSVIKGYSLLRAYENDYVKDITIAGAGIDLGAKSKDAKYYEYFDMSAVTKVYFVDYYSGGLGVVKLDLEKPFDIESAAFDFVLMFNVMEHIYNYKNLLDETVRILKPGGKLHGFVPFMWHYHPDPNDYFRFSEQALKNIISRDGLSEVKVIPICYGPFKVAATVIGSVLKFKALKIFIYLIAIYLDKVLMRVSSGATRYSMAYYFSATKL